MIGEDCAFRAILWEPIVMMMMMMMMMMMLFSPFYERSRDRIDRNERGVLDAIVDAGVLFFCIRSLTRAFLLLRLFKQVMSR